MSARRRDHQQQALEVECAELCAATEKRVREALARRFEAEAEKVKNEWDGACPLKPVRVAVWRKAARLARRWKLS